MIHATSMLSRFGHLEGILIFFQFFSWIDNIDFEQLRVSSEIFWELILLSKHILWCQSTFWYKISTIKSKTTTQEKTLFFQFLIPKIWKLNFFFFAILRFLLKKHGKSLPKKNAGNFEFFWKVKNTYQLWNYFFTVWHHFWPQNLFWCFKRTNATTEIFFFIFWHFHRPPPTFEKKNS